MAKKQSAGGGDQANRPNAGSLGVRMRDSKQKRISARKKRDRLLVGGAALVLLAALVVISLIFFYKVRNVAISDEKHLRYTDAEILGASGIRTGDSLLWLKTEEVARGIEERLPYLENVRVRRVFPFDVEISVSYARPAMAYQGKDGAVLLSASGKVLQTGVREVSDYVARLAGVEITSAVPGRPAVFAGDDTFRCVTETATAFADAGYLNVTVYDFSDTENVTVEVDYRVDVLLGRIDSVKEKLAFGKKVIDDSLEKTKDSDEKLVVDMKAVDKKAFVRTQSEIDGAREAASARAQMFSDAETTVEGTTEAPIRYGAETAADDGGAGETAKTEEGAEED